MITAVFRSLCFYIGLVPQFFENIESFFANISTSALIAIPAIAVALLLPLAFFLIENSGAYPFDRKLIIKDIIYFEPLSFLVIAESVLLCLADTHIVFKMLAIITDGFLVVIMISVIRHSYQWLCSSDDKTITTSFRQSLRMQYLKSITNINELYETWMQILKDHDTSGEKNKQSPANSLPKNQTGLVDALVYALRQLEKAPAENNDAMKHTTLINAIIEDFDNLIFDNANQYRTLIRYATGFAEDQLIYEKTSDPNDYYLFVSSNKLNLLKKALKSILGHSAHAWSYIFFDELEEAIKGMQNEQEQRIFYRVFLREIFELFDTNPPAVSRLWNHMSFLRNLNLVEKGQVKQKDTKNESILHAYEIYLSESISSCLNNDKNKRGQALDLISSHLFEDVDLIFWFDIITFYTISVYGRNFQDAQRQRIKTWCQLKTKRQFGQLSRLYAPLTPYTPGLTDEERMLRYLKIEDKLNNQGQETVMKIFCTYYGGIVNSHSIRQIREIIISVIAEEEANDATTQHRKPKNIAARYSDSTFDQLKTLFISLGKMLDFIESKDNGE